MLSRVARICVFMCTASLRISGPVIAEHVISLIRRGVDDEDLARLVPPARSTDFNPGRPKSGIAVWTPDVRGFNGIGSAEKA